MNPAIPEPLTDAQLRALRDEVFDDLTTDKNWAWCRETWARPEETAWLQAHRFNLSTI